MAQLLITVIVIATFGFLLGAGVNYIDREGLRDASVASVIGAEHTRLVTGIEGYRRATGALPPMAEWQELITPYAPEPLRRLPDSLRWVYVARETGYGLCADYPEAGRRSRAKLRQIDCADLPERLAGGLVLMHPARTRLFDDTPRPVPPPGTGRVDLIGARYGLMNVSDVPLHILRMGFDDDTAFALGDDNGCLGAVLAPLARCSFGVTFRAAGNGSFAEDLTIEAEPAGTTG